MTDPAPDAEWEVWYQDTFDRECPRRVEASGRGLTAGLTELWARHLFETVGPDGKRGFSRFNLWWKQEGKSIRVVGSWDGMVRLREWIFGRKQQADKEDRALLTRIAAVHSRLILAGQTSEGILAAAEGCGNRQAFERALWE